MLQGYPLPELAEGEVLLSIAPLPASAQPVFSDSVLSDSATEFAVVEPSEVVELSEIVQVAVK